MLMVVVARTVVMLWEIFFKLKSAVKYSTLGYPSMRVCVSLRIKIIQPGISVTCGEDSVPTG